MSISEKSRLSSEIGFFDAFTKILIYFLLQNPFTKRVPIKRWSLKTTMDVFSYNGLDLNEIKNLSSISRYTTSRCFYDSYFFSASVKAGAINACSLLEIPFALAIRCQFSLIVFFISAMVDLALVFETPKNSLVSKASSVEIVESFSVTLSERFSP